VCVCARVRVCARACVLVCVLTFPSSCLSDGAALRATAASRCGCSLTGEDRVTESRGPTPSPSGGGQRGGCLWLCDNPMVCWDYGGVFVYGRGDVCQLLCSRVCVCGGGFVCDRKQRPRDFAA